MDCPNCSTSNPNDNSFCGACGRPLNGDEINTWTISHDEFLHRTEQAIDAKLSSLDNNEIVTFKATDEVIERTWKWLTRLAFVVALPGALIAGLAIILGYGSYEEIRERYDELVAGIESTNARLSETIKTVDVVEQRSIEYRKKTDRLGKSLVLFESRENSVSEEIKAAKQIAEAFSEKNLILEKQFDIFEKEMGETNIAMADLHFEIAFAAEDPERSIKHYTKALSFRPEFAQAYVNRGNAYSEIGKYGSARDDLNIATALDSNHLTPYVIRGKISQLEGDYDQAVVEFDQAIELGSHVPDSYLFYYYRGITKFTTGRFKEALQDFSESARLESSHSYAAIWAYLSRARDGNPEIERLREEAVKFDKEKWPGPVISIFLGDRKIEAVRDAAQGNDQECATDFYFGQLKMVQGRQEEASHLFRSALRSCAQNILESSVAEEELRRLGEN